MLNQILQILGHQPTATAPTRTTYRSPWNTDEKTPSCHVFKSEEWDNIDPFREFNFKDNSSGNGGNTFQFIMDYFNIPFSQTNRKIAELTGMNYQEHSSPTPPKPNPTNSFSLNQTKESYKIVKTSTLKNQALINYIEERGISQKLAEKYLGEIYYQIDSKNYFALSFANDGVGREVRNKYFKGSFGKKNISRVFPTPKDKRVKVFEGFMNFLSYLEINKNAPLSNYLILNSASLKEKGLRAIQGIFEAFELYLDNDRRGDEATDFFMQNLPNVMDKRIHYKEHGDLNDFLLSMRA